MWGIAALAQGLLRNARGPIDLCGPFAERHIFVGSRAQVPRHRELRRQFEHSMCRQPRLIHSTELPKCQDRLQMSREITRAFLNRASRRRQPFVMPARDQVRNANASEESTDPRIDRTDAHGTLEMPECGIAFPDECPDGAGAVLHRKKIRACVAGPAAQTGKARRTRFNGPAGETPCGPSRAAPP
jgi:hypothetical protein